MKLKQHGFFLLLPISLSVSILPAPARAMEETGSIGSAELPDNALSLIISVPHPVDLSYDMRMGSSWSWGVDAGGLPFAFGQSGGNPIDITDANVEARLRWHPFSGSFFIGFAAGYQLVTGSTTATITDPGLPQSVPISMSGSIRSAYLTPELGWFWVFHSGFTLGLDAGWQFPFGSNTQVTVTSTNSADNSLLGAAEGTSQYQQIQSDVQKLGNEVGNTGIPYVGIRLGWSF